QRASHRQLACSAVACGRVNSTVIPLRFKTVTQHRSVVMQLNGMSTGFRARGWVGFDIVILESYWRTPRALVRCGQPATMHGVLTNRWTRAESAGLSSTTCP